MLRVVQAALHDAMGAAIKQCCQIVGSHDSDAEEASDNMSESGSESASESASESQESADESETSSMLGQQGANGSTDESTQKQDSATLKPVRRKKKHMRQGRLWSLDGLLHM